MGGANPQLREGFSLLFFKNHPERLVFRLVTENLAGRRTTRNAMKDLDNPNRIWYYVVGTYNQTTGEQRLYVVCRWKAG